MLFEAEKPLAERMRPVKVNDIVGQDHLVGEDGVLSRFISRNAIPSMILWGPPGVGKTTIAEVISNELNLPFYTLSAISSGVKDVREVIEKAKRQQGTILFIDEIHRFNKSQQDALLAAVEKGTIILIGATTENPSFEVNAALLSRCQVYTLKHLSIEDLLSLLDKAKSKDDKLKNKEIEIKENGALLKYSGGDARRLLNLFELAVNNASGEEKVIITDELVMKVAQQKMAIYDKSGEQHYDLISAFIKSMRGSDPNASLYYLARMIEGGEDVKFIARRLVIFASEDIGNANPTAMVMSVNTFQAVNLIGYPEAEIILSQCVVYLACSPKSNASYKAIKEARKFVKETGDLPIPLNLRNAPTKLMKDLGYGKAYKYPHDYQNNFVFEEYFPEEIIKTKFYEPGDNARENEMRKRMRALWREKYGY
ncbi:replication-associated recombination protein A [Marinigracilibium pacificum]|uniref:Replication-associated recombination protein A n=1 Tax=Marinigracilibium pacificum TaxID=2729599 RepID=A0A848IZW1_9BACT|nr:replication-associated recombination protein A [Marinigracilibium pacificum]NMM48678.1 replication-associated recombination protein A [Marinigracilibium pacificum]